MAFVIQPNVYCENCIKCGARPVVTQLRNMFSVMCPNEECDNVVTGTLINLNEWNRINKKPGQG
ncbi:hypothetical protein BEL04_01130 [Mucilaginibacter sp. PPCGB 2223]|uniref:hypothetical protein n=1 Tax=Mucilaginibacter sp. PPCGB 2223 TaxID=1886027 RepID=UPI000824BCF1|nr:hypothetical protein [Mucilaginibacter sp. PPCGB 2223]OCX52959.1 hypothetical protein BEL04_01130 [Mucilaginibacter sp. PPCGB 2223]